MHARRLPALALLGALASCYGSHEQEWEMLECEPRVSPPHFFRSDEPRPRGRIHACESALRADEELVARAMELGCTELSREGWTLEGACDYALAARAWSSLREASSCDELALRAAVDPCARPDPDRYWRGLRD